jgi:hypothetical protein
MCNGCCCFLPHCLLPLLPRCYQGCELSCCLLIAASPSCSLLAAALAVSALLTVMVGGLAGSLRCYLPLLRGLAWGPTPGSANVGR